MKKLSWGPLHSMAARVSFTPCLSQGFMGVDGRTRVLHPFCPTQSLCPSSSPTPKELVHQQCDELQCNSLFYHYWYAGQSLLTHAEQTEGTQQKVSDYMILVAGSTHLDPHCLDFSYAQNICIIH